jgi:type IV secretion system protein VirB10
MMRAFGPWRRRTKRGAGRGEPPVPLQGEAAGVAVGERGTTLASRARSLQARLNSLLAVALAVGIVVAMLVWYYGEALRHVGRAAAAAPAASPVAGGLGPPPLGPIPAPQLRATPAPASPARRGRGAVPEVRTVAAALTLPRVPPTPLSAWRPRSHPASVGAGQGLRRTGLARSLSGGVFVAARSQAALGGPGTPMAAGRSRGRSGTAESGGTRLRALLRPATLSATRAQLLPQRRLLLAKGTFIDCTLETAIDSTLPGMTTCITATDTFSADGTVVLLPRGTQLIGQTRGEVRQGMARVFVIWTQARTPAGVVVRLDSPATDSLGRSGLTGTVDRHFWERFGAALLISTLTGVIQARAENSVGTVVIDPTASEDVLTQALRSAQDIAPTTQVPNGQRIEVLVARDVDFRSVYELVAR